MLDQLVGSVVEILSSPPSMLRPPGSIVLLFVSYVTQLVLNMADHGHHGLLVEGFLAALAGSCW
jgi:hypothetical protein